MSWFRFKAIKALTFGRFVDASVDNLDHSFVVVHGANETGKSTLTEFLTWMTGGPVGTAVDSQRFGDYRQKLKGRLLAELNGTDVDIEGTFEIKNRDAPNDLRKGTIGASEVNNTTMSAQLGNLQPADYAFIYRFIGPILHDTESADNFAGVLTQFAIGSAVSDINPAAVARDLSDKARSLKNEADALRRDIKKVGDQIREEQKSPARLADIEKELVDIAMRIKAIDDANIDRARDIEICKFAIAAFEANATLRSLQGEFDSVDAPSETWADAVKNVSDIRRDVATARGLIDSIRGIASDADSLASDVGLTVDDAATRTLSLSDKSRVQTAGDALKEATNKVVATQEDFDRGAQACREAMEKVSQAAKNLGIASNDVLNLSTVIGTWNELNNAAVTWGNADGAAAQQQGTAEKAEQAAAAARAHLANEEKYSGNEPAVSSGNTPVVIAAVAVAGLIAGAFWRPALIVGAVLVAVVLGRWWWSSRKPSALLAPVGADAVTRVRDIESQAIEARRIAEIARIDAETAREAFAGRLAPFGVDIPPVELAQNVCGRIKEASDAADDLRDEESRQRGRQAAVDLAQSELSDARGEFDRAATSCGIVYTGDLAGLSAWLDTYSAAITKCKEMADLTSRVHEKEVAIRALLGSAITPDTDIYADRLMQDLDDQARLAHDYADLASRLGEAELKARAAAGNKKEVEILLQSVDTLAELQARVDAMTGESTTTQIDRDQLIEQRKTLDTEKQSIENTEFINRLNLDKSALEEQLEEKVAECEVFTVAAKTLADVINDFQTKNQAPLVKRANEILDAVVSGYGDLVYSTDDAGKPIIERVNHASRLRTSKLSTGSRALVYLALRLAFVEADHAKRGIALPVLCDDPLVHVDDTRAPEVIKILAKASETHQVILFTCHDETRDLAAAAGARVVSL